MNEEWLARERATATCVRACFDEFIERRHLHSPDYLLALCQLTWLVRGDEADNTARVIAPAIGTFLGKELASRTHEDLQKELISTNVPERVRQALKERVGFTNFYNAYRNRSREWMRHHSQEVLPLLKHARRLRADSRAREIYREMQTLSPIPRDGAKMAAANLLTPVIACLDPRARSPIINGRDNVRERLRVLGLAHLDLVAQFDGLTGLLHQGGFGDAFELDVAGPHIPAIITRAPRKSSHHRLQGNRMSRALGEKDVGEVRVLRKVQSHSYKRLHNEMTNDLQPLLNRAGLHYNEGARRDCLYDVRIINYDDGGRDLLVEAKAAIDMPFCRMAVGQLLDYRRQLPSRARTDMAALFPSRPSRDARDFMRGVGVKVLWFDGTMKRIQGDLAFD